MSESRGSTDYTKCKKPVRAPATDRMKRFIGFGMAAALVLSLVACAANATGSGHPNVGDALKTGLNRQVIHPRAPADPTPADGLPGELATRLFKKRYVKTITEKENKNKDDKASREFQ
jgi:hypothetical protein